MTISANIPWTAAVGRFLGIRECWASSRRGRVWLQEPTHFQRACPLCPAPRWLCRDFLSGRLCLHFRFKGRSSPPLGGRWWRICLSEDGQTHPSSQQSQGRPLWGSLSPLLVTSLSCSCQTSGWLLWSESYSIGSFLHRTLNELGSCFLDWPKLYLADSLATRRILSDLTPVNKRLGRFLNNVSRTSLKSAKPFSRQALSKSAHSLLAPFVMA